MNLCYGMDDDERGSVPVEYSGTAAGLICTAGSIPEIFVSILAGNMIDSHPGDGLQVLFLFPDGSYCSRVCTDSDLETVLKRAN